MISLHASVNTVFKYQLQSTGDIILIFVFTQMSDEKLPNFELK